MNITTIALFCLLISSSLVAQVKGYAEEIGCAGALYAQKKLSIKRLESPSYNFTSTCTVKCRVGARLPMISV